MLVFFFKENINTSGELTFLFEIEVANTSTAVQKCVFALLFYPSLFVKPNYLYSSKKKDTNIFVLVKEHLTKLYKFT